MWALIGIMAALVRRGSSGKGGQVCPSLLDSAFALMCHQVLSFQVTGQLPQKLGSGAPSAAPYRVFEAADGSFMLATASDRQFARLCGTLGLPATAIDPRFASMPARLTHREALDALLADKFRHHSVAFWIKTLGDAGISAGPVNDLRDALALPVVTERHLFALPQYKPGAGGLPLLRLPIDKQCEGVMRPPPRLGEHTAEVLREAGVEEVAIVQLTQAPPSQPDATSFHK